MSNGPPVSEELQLATACLLLFRYSQVRLTAACPRYPEGIAEAYGEKPWMLRTSRGTTDRIWIIRGRTRDILGQCQSKR